MVENVTAETLLTGSPQMVEYKRNNRERLMDQSTNTTTPILAEAAKPKKKKINCAVLSGVEGLKLFVFIDTMV